ncbi:tyrosine protein kinase [Pelomyxa schiedti]|nr:tyrosine protein kinase [Pelomyxa schiedti]
MNTTATTKTLLGCFVLVCSILLSSLRGSAGSNIITERTLRGTSPCDPEVEGDALCDIKNQNHPVNWMWPDPCSWGTPCDEYSLTGVTCENGCVSVIDLNWNMMSGSLPNSIGNFTKLKYMSMHNNYLSGSIPASLFKITTLTSLYMESNSLVGTLPSMTLLTMLHTLDLSTNLLEGSIPPTIRYLTRLTYLNTFYGTIPSEIGSTNLTTLVLRDNNFVGTIPNHITKLPLTSLDISSNVLTGTIPSGMLPLLTSINLASNYLSGDYSFLSSESYCSLGQNCFLDCSEATNCGASYRGDTWCYCDVATHCDDYDSSTNETCSSEYPPLCAFKKRGGGLSGGAIAGIIIAILVIGGITGGAIFAFIVIKKKHPDLPRNLKSMVSEATAAVPNILSISTSTKTVTNTTNSTEAPVVLSRLCYTDETFDTSCPQATASTFLLTVTPSSALEFGLGSHQAPINQELEDNITLTNPSKSTVLFKLVCPQNPRYTIQMEPQTGSLKPSHEIDVHVKMTVNCTTSIETNVLVMISTKDKVDPPEMYLPLRIAFDTQLSTSLDSEEINLQEPPIGEGGYGVVYKGEWRGQLVAVKLLKNQTSTALTDFLREVHILDTVRCPQIVNFLGACKLPGTLSIVTEFAPLGNLSDCMKKHRMSLVLKSKCFLDCSRGMQFLHQSSLLHRDLKPDNLLMVSLDTSAAINCKLTDFGTTRDFNKAQETQLYTLGVGTPVYMAPELLENGKYNSGADVYSFAVLMYHVVTERPPYEEFESMWKICEFVMAGNRMPLDKTAYPPLAELIEVCWNQDRHARPSFDDITPRIETIYQNYLAKPPPPSRKQPPVPPPKHSTPSDANNNSKDKATPPPARHHNKPESPATPHQHHGKQQEPKPSSSKPKPPPPPPRGN